VKTVVVDSKEEEEESGGAEGEDDRNLNLNISGREGEEEEYLFRCPLSLTPFDGVVPFVMLWPSGRMFSGEREMRC